MYVCMYGLQNEYELQRLQQSSKDSRGGLSICVAKSSRPGPRGAAAGAAGAGLESKAEQGWSGKGFGVGAPGNRWSGRQLRLPQVWESQLSRESGVL